MFQNGSLTKQNISSQVETHPLIQLLNSSPNAIKPTRDSVLKIIGNYKSIQIWENRRYIGDHRAVVDEAKTQLIVSTDGFFDVKETEPKFRIYWDRYTIKRKSYCGVMGIYEGQNFHKRWCHQRDEKIVEEIQ